MPPRLIPALLGSLLALFACRAAPLAQPDLPRAARLAAPGRPDMPALVAEFAQDASDLDRFYAVRWSQTRLDRLERLHASWRGRLDAVDFAALDGPGRVDWILLMNHLDARDADLALARTRLAEMDDLLPFRRTIADLEESRWRVEEPPASEMAARVASIPDAVTRARTLVESRRAPAPDAVDPPGPPVTPVLAQRTADAVDSLRRTLDATCAYYAGFKPEHAWWLRRPQADALDALDDYARFLRRDIAGIRGEPDDPLVGDPIGSDALLAALRAEMIAYTPEELIEIARRELAWCEARLAEAAEEMGIAHDPRAALERVKSLHQPPGAQDLLVAAQAREAIDFVESRDLVSVPDLCRELWRTEMISPESQRFWPFAYYGGLHMGVAYPTESMPHADKVMSMRGNNEHFTRIVTPHELIPGHHLQGFIARRVNPHRQLFSTPFLVEGWALHWEMLLWDLGWARSPEDRVGMLFWRTHRCARIIVSLQFHLGLMSPQEMIDFLVDRVGHERLTATSEVRRYVGDAYSPLYQAGYMLGGLQLRALHNELVASGRMTQRDFHDAVLSLGPIPIELIRAALHGDLPDRDFTPAWRFADPEAPE